MLRQPLKPATPPDPGPGWRLVDTDRELIVEGDEFYCVDRWIPASNWMTGGKPDNLYYRRKVSAA